MPIQTVFLDAGGVRVFCVDLVLTEAGIALSEATVAALAELDAGCGHHPRLV